VKEFATVDSGAENEDFSEVTQEVDLSIYSGRRGFEFDFAVDPLAPDDLAASPPIPAGPTRR